MDTKLEKLAQRLEPRGKLRRAWPLTGGISAEMTALEIERPEGEVTRLILRRPSEQTLRRNLRAASDEFKVLQAVAGSGVAAPAPRYLDETGEIYPAPYLVIEYLEGAPVFAPADPEGALRQLATRLARIHSIDSARLDLAFLPRAAGPAASAPRPQAGAAPALDEGRLRDTLAAARPQPNAPRLLHGDYWPGNILWRDGQLTAVVDWEDAAIGDPLMDLAISRLDLLTIFGADAMHAFTRHYQARLAVDDTNLPYWDLCAALRLVRLVGSDLAGWAAFFAPFGRPDITEQTIRAHYQQFVDQALEKLGARGGANRNSVR